METSISYIHFNFLHSLQFHNAQHGTWVCIFSDGTLKYGDQNFTLWILRVTLAASRNVRDHYCFLG
jgi:hypothetical protein